MGEQSSQCNGVSKSCSVNSFWTPVELCGTEELTALGFDNRSNICQLEQFCRLWCFHAIC